MKFYCYCPFCEDMSAFDDLNALGSHHHTTHPDKFPDGCLHINFHDGEEFWVCNDCGYYRSSNGTTAYADGNRKTSKDPVRS